MKTLLITYNILMITRTCITGGQAQPSGSKDVGLMIIIALIGIVLFMSTCAASWSEECSNKEGMCDRIVCVIVNFFKMVGDCLSKPFHL